MIRLEKKGLNCWRKCIRRPVDLKDYDDDEGEVGEGKWSGKQGSIVDNQVESEKHLCVNYIQDRMVGCR